MDLLNSLVGKTISGVSESGMDSVNKSVVLRFNDGEEIVFKIEKAKQGIRLKHWLMLVFKDQRGKLRGIWGSEQGRSPSFSII